MTALLSHLLLMFTGASRCVLKKLFYGVQNPSCNSLYIGVERKLAGTDIIVKVAPAAAETRTDS